MLRRWVCEGCQGLHRNSDFIWLCPGCEKEICENCFDRLAHCKACCQDKSPAFLREVANEHGWCFEEQL